MVDMLLVDRIRNENRVLTATQIRRPLIRSGVSFVEPEITKHGDATKITATAPRNISESGGATAGGR